MKRRNPKQPDSKPGPASRPLQPDHHAPPTLLNLQQAVGNRATQQAINGQTAGVAIQRKANVGAPSLTEPELAQPELAAPATSTVESPETTTTAAPASAPRETAVTPTMAWIVEDHAAAAAPGQLRKSEFLAQLKHAVCSTSDQGLAPAGLNSDGCPWIAHWFAVYEGKSGAHLEHAISRFAPETATAQSARDYVRLVAARVRQSVDRWVLTGEVTGVPSEMPGEPGPLGAIFPKSRDGIVRTDADPQAVQAQLGSGRPLDADVRSTMEGAFGASFGGVRLHTDPQSARLSRNLGARAFTVGQDVAFDQGEYRPGTPVGDALIAHELAHVVQQGPAAGNTTAAGAAAGPMAKGEGPATALEEEADRSAVSAVASVWSGTKQWLGDTSATAFPRLRSGLQLQRCSSTKKSTKTDALDKLKKDPKAKAAAEEAEEDSKCPTGDEAKKVGKLSKSMMSTYKLAAVDAGDKSCWTLAELKKVEKAFQKIPAEQLPALDGVTLRRVPTADCAGHSADGCFIESADAATGQRQDRLELGDAAFAKDKDFDEGGAKFTDSQGNDIDLIPSQKTTIHEIGHAVESVTRRAAEAERLATEVKLRKPEKAYDDAFNVFDNAMPAGGTSPGWSNTKEKTYSKALLSWNKRLLKVYEPTKKIPNNPGHADLATQATSMNSLVKSAAAAEASLKKAAKALPSSSTVRDTTRESELEAAQRAAGKLVTALENRRDAQKVVDAAQAKEAAASDAIKLSKGAAPTGMTRRLAEFVAIIRIRKIDVATHKPVPAYGRDNWPDKPQELFADLYEWSITDPQALKNFHPDMAEFFKVPIGVKGKSLRKEVAKWLKKNR